MEANETVSAVTGRLDYIPPESQTFLPPGCYIIMN